MADVLDRLRKALTDRYAIEREIGSGGMATVYLAEDLRHRRKVASRLPKRSARGCRSKPSGRPRTEVVR